MKLNFFGYYLEEMSGFKKLKVWQLSFHLSTEIYKVTKMFSKEEKFGLVSQMRRCAISIPSNIAEGYGRGSDAQFKMFLQYSLGSANELETQLLIAHELGECKKDNLEFLLSQLTSVQKMLANFISKLKRSINDYKAKDQKLKTKSP